MQLCYKDSFFDLLVHGIYIYLSNFLMINKLMRENNLFFNEIEY